MLETIFAVVVFAAVIILLVHDGAYEYNSELRDYERKENVCITTRC